jgi:cation diffusion facilitator family transporter
MSSLVEVERLKSRAASASLLFNLGSTILKIVAAVLTGSVSLLSEAIHSATDVASSTIALLGVKAAAVPPDEEHPYGHGKIESLAGFGESILLFLVVIYVVAEAIHRLVVGHTVQSLDLALAVMALSTVGSFAVSRYVFGVAKATGSIALKSNGQHLVADFWTSVGVLVALGLTRYAGWQQADAVIAICLSAWIGYSAWRLATQAFQELIDVRLTPEELAQISELLKAEGRLLSYHRLRTRRSGNMRYIDMHIVVPNDWSVVQAHEVADDLEKRIEEELAPAQVVIHVDPFSAVKAKP